MPLLQIKTNVKVENINSIAQQASQLAAKILGKPESYVMVNITDESTLIFAGSNEPCAHLKLKSLGIDESQTAIYSEILCRFMAEKVNIPASRTYIEFSNPERHMWGWNNRTF